MTFLVISSISYVFSPSKRSNAAGTTAQPTFYSIHSQNFTIFTLLFSTFPLLQFQVYNYNCTIAILQLQTTFYNCKIVISCTLKYALAIPPPPFVNWTDFPCKPVQMSKCASQWSESIQNRLSPMFPHLLHIDHSNPDELYDLHLKLIFMPHDHLENL